MSSNKEKIEDIFRKVSWFDKNRWIDDANYATMNLSTELTNSEIILTHFLCYISDRQMPYYHIWDRGGFVYSDLVESYSKEKMSVQSLLNPEIKDSFVKKRNDDPEKLKFISKRKVPQNNLLIRNYGYKEKEPVIFIPRYYPSDIKSIMQTLSVLENYNRNIIEYIAQIIETIAQINETNPEKNLIKKIGFSLYLLAYYNIGQPKANQHKKIESDVEKNTKEIMDILNNKQKFEMELKKFMNSNRFKQKRMWCSLRDYVKSYEFSKYMIEGFKEINKENIVEIWEQLDKTELELPGDVWNNNLKFKNCLFSDICEPKLLKWEAPRFIREIYENSEPECGYPEMFDFTFDFIPRMCEKDMCKFCIFNEKNNIEDLCTKDETKYCPILLVSCGYENKCNKKECVFLN